MHPPKDGVIVYVTVPVMFDVFTGESVIAPVPLAVTPALICALALDVQENVAPAMLVVGVKFKATALQISA